MMLFPAILLMLISCNDHKAKTKSVDIQNDTNITVGNQKNIVADNQKKIIEKSYGFADFISDCIKVPYTVFDTEQDIEKKYPEINNAKVKNKEKAINFFVKNYKPEYIDREAMVSIPLLFVTNNYYVLLVEYQTDAMAICQDLFVLDETGKLISQKQEITYHNFGDELITDEYLKLEIEKNDTIRIETKQIYEAKNENAVLPDVPAYHFYKIDESGNILQLKKENIENDTLLN